MKFTQYVMKIKYFQDTDTLYIEFRIEFRPVEVAKTRDFDEKTLVDLDRDGNIFGLTLSMQASGRGFRHSPTSRSEP